MIEKIAFMQVEDNMVAFERENGDTIIYPMALVPASYKEGDVIKATVHGEDFIEFLELDTCEMERRGARVEAKKSRLRDRARRSTNK